MARQSIRDNLNTISAILVLIVALVSGYFQYYKTGGELSVKILSDSELTEVSATPNLKAKYTYNEHDIDYLWKVDIKLENTGRVTLVGEGEKSNIIDNNIPFEFDPTISILDFEKSYSTIPGLSIKRDQNKFYLSFDQWRSGEIAIVSFFLTSKGKLLDRPHPNKIKRSIIDGNIMVFDETLSATEKMLSKTAWLPEIMETPVYYISKAVTIGAFGVMLLILAVVVFDGLPYSIWYIRNKYIIISHVNSIDGLTEEEKVLYVKEPYRMDAEQWSGFVGKIPKKTAPITNTLSATFTVFIIVFISAVGFLYSI